MDGNGLDLGKILKMVTDNPAMLQTALSFAGKLKDNMGTDTPKPDDKQEKAKPSALPILQVNTKDHSAREDERRLLLALRPYLNETRREKIDFVLKILQLLELAGTLGLTFDGKMKGGGSQDV